MIDVFLKYGNFFSYWLSPMVERKNVNFRNKKFSVSVFKVNSNTNNILIDNF